MKVLVGCECSGIVREAFRAKGHEAWSCDLKPAEDGSLFHYQESIIRVLEETRWDLVILHPECTALTVAGNHVYARGKPKFGERLSQASWVEGLWNLALSRSRSVCLENPVGVLPTLTNLPQPKYIQPYNFGHDASKKTGLWLNKLPPLVNTERVVGRFVDGNERWSNQTDSGQNRLGPSEDRATNRSRTYQGVADAMADQWG